MTQPFDAIKPGQHKEKMQFCWSGLIEIDKVPNSVLPHLLETAGIIYKPERLTEEKYRTKCRELYRTLKPIKLHKPYSQEDYPLIARFLNPQTRNWSPPQIDRALEVYQLIIEQHKNPSAEFTIGYPTPLAPNNISVPLMTYICLRATPIGLDQNLTLTQLTTMTRLLTMTVTQIFAKYRIEDWISTYVLDDNSKHETKQKVPSKRMEKGTKRVSQEGLTQSYHNLTSLTRLQNQYQPKDIPEALALAALLYGIDLSLADNAIREYQHLAETVIVSTKPSNRLREYRGVFQGKYITYSPEDLKLSKWVNVQGAKYVDLTKHYNSIFGINYYTEAVLRELGRKEGYNPRELKVDSDNLIRLLQQTTEIETFYEGLHPDTLTHRIGDNSKHLAPHNLTDKTIIGQESVIDLNPQHLVQVGLRCEGLVSFTYQELADLFMANQNFTNPLFPRAVYPNLAIRKLKLLCSPIENVDNKAYVESGKAACYNAIFAVEMRQDNLNAQGQKLRQQYLTFSSKVQGNIIKCLQALVQLSMYMRGWSGPNKGQGYPIGEVPVADSESVQILVAEALCHWDKTVAQLGDKAQLILGLPILLYRGGEFIAGKKADGLTIEGRLRIVIEGESSGNINACIRSSSNWLASTGYRYLHLLGQDAEFDVRLLRYIS